MAATPTVFQLHGEWHFQHGSIIVGPYATKAEAEDDRRGLIRFERYKDEPGFITTTPLEKTHHESESHH